MFRYLFYWFFTGSIFNLGITIVFVIYRVLCGFIVSNNAQRRKLDNSTFWGVISFFTGLVAVILYFALNLGLGKKSKPNKQHIKVVIATIFASVGIIAVSLGLNVVATINQAVNYNANDLVLEKRGTLNYVTYDKMGKEYNLVDLFDKLDLLVFGDETAYGRPPVYSKDGKLLDSDKDILVDENGYGHYEKDIVGELEQRETNYSSVYFDKEHKPYYYSTVCSWDKDGNLLLNDDYKKATYENTKPAEFDYID